MPVVIEEVTAEAMKPVAPAQPAQPPTEVPAGTAQEARRTLKAIRRAQARAERLRAD